MDLPAAIRTIRPLKGQVIPIKTVQETQAREEFCDALVAEVSMKSASKVIKALDSTFPRDSTLSLQHLRRFARSDQLPEGVKTQVTRREDNVPPSSSSSSSSQTIFVLIPPPLPETQILESVLAPFAPQRGGAETATSDENETTIPTPTPQPPSVSLYTTQIPLQPPLNSGQADQWSKSLWPVTFNPAAPRAVIAPPPQILNGARESIQPWAGHYLVLAQIVAKEAAHSGRGRGVGAVIVDPSIDFEPENRIETDHHHSLEPIPDEGRQWMHPIIAVAGDARYSRREGGRPSQADLHAGQTGREEGGLPGPNPASLTYDPDLEGGPELHALMRAVDMVARRRRDGDGEHHETSDKKKENKDDVPLTCLESYFLYRRDGDDPHPEADVTLPSTKRQKLHSTGNRKEEGEAETSGHDHSALPTTTATTATTATTNVRSRILPRSQGGYLCTDLDIYLSHEPCLCCCMGLLLSRFRAVIVPRKGRMRSTGGLASEDVPGFPVSEESADISESVVGEGQRMYYGLHWRKELNWRALGFEFVELDDDGGGDVQGGIYQSLKSVSFHA